MPTLVSLARRAEVGRARVIPDGMAPGSDVGNMSIFGYDPTEFHTGRAPIEAAALGIRLAPDEVAYRCNLVTLGDDGTMVDFAGGHPSSEDSRRVIEALEAEVGGEVRFYAGVEYRHIVVAPAAWADAECTPPHDLTGKPAVWPTGPAAEKLRLLMEASRDVVGRSEIDANQIWLWGQGHQPNMPAFSDRFGLDAALSSAVDLVRGLGVLTGIEVVDVEGMTPGYDTDYAAQLDCALDSLADGADLFIIHVEATDEAGHAGDVEAKVTALENWDRHILSGLVDGMDRLGPWRMLWLPDHATPLELRTHTADPVPYMLFDSNRNGPGGVYSEQGVAGSEPVAGHELMGRLVAQR